MRPKEFRESCGIDIPEWNNIIDIMLKDYATQQLKLCNLPCVTNRRELLIAVFKTVKGVTIPETDEQIEYFVDKYST